MDEIYNMTSFANSTNVFDMVSAVNTSSEGLLGMMAIISLFIILLVALLKNNPPAESFFTSSAVTALFALVFWAVRLVDFGWFLAGVIGMAVSGVILYKKNN